MGRLRYADLAHKGLDVLDMISLTRDEFQTLVAPFEAALYLLTLALFKRASSTLARVYNTSMDSLTNHQTVLREIEISFLPGRPETHCSAIFHIQSRGGVLSRRARDSEVLLCLNVN